MKYFKSEHRKRLTDEYLKAILLVACTNTKSNLNDILRVKQQFYKSQLIFCIDFFVVGYLYFGQTSRAIHVYCI